MNLSYIALRNLVKNRKNIDKNSNHRMEKRYRNFAEAEIHGNESERLRIARELHDDTIHRLILIGQRLELLKYDNPDSPMIQGLSDVIDVTNDSIAHIRQVIKELRPSHLTKMGILPAIKGLVEEKQIQLSHLIEFKVKGEPFRLNDSAELIIYRVAQTALQNVKLHSKCTKAKVSVEFDKKLITLTIEDNGRGFDVPCEGELFENAHFGLLGMKERTELCNGKFMIHSLKNMGTCVIVEIPKDGNEPATEYLNVTERK